jgi:hypothetical protein
MHGLSCKKEQGGFNFKGLEPYLTNRVPRQMAEAIQKKIEILKQGEQFETYDGFYFAGNWQNWSNL